MNHAMLSDSTTFLEHVSNYLDNTGILWIGVLVLLLPVISRFLGSRAWLGLGVVCTALLIGLTSYHAAAEGWRASARPECLWGSAFKAAKEFGVLYGAPVAASMAVSRYVRKFKVPLLIELGGVALTAVVACIPAVWVMFYIQQQADWCLTR
jgi:hypothetical protein